MPQLDPVPVGVVLDSAGDIASGALLKVYTAGTTTPVTTYQDSALSTAHAFPVVASAAGRFSEVYVVAGNYKVDLQDSEGASLPGYPRDNVTIAASGVTTGATYGRSVQLSDDYSDATAWTVESSVGITARSQAYDSSTQLFDSPYVLELAGDASDATNKVESAASVVTVTPGQEYRVTAPIYATGSPTSTLEIGFEWYNSAGTSLSESAQSYSNSDITTGEVLYGTHVAAAPSSAALMRVIIQRKTASVTGNWYAGAARLEISIPAATRKAELSIDDLVTLSGAADGATHLGTFTGSTISDDGTVKAGMQELETALEVSGPPHIVLTHETASGADGGSTTSGSWEPRPLNTAERNTLSAAFASNAVTLAAATYYVEGWGAGHDCDAFQTRLRDTTGAATLLVGAPSDTNGTDSQNTSHFAGVFTLGTSSSVRMENRCGLSRATTGFGKSQSWDAQIFACLKIWKIT